MSEVRLENLCKSFSENTVVSDFSLSIADGEFLSLLGPSGCGKTTILRMIAGLEEIDSGHLFIDGKRYNHLPARERGLAMVFQSYALFPHMTVQENLAFGLRIRKFSRLEAWEKIEWAIHITGLDGLEKRLPKELSGGQRQRVALGRALVLDPKVLLLDEPLSNLDTALRDRMTAELKRLHRQIGKTIIYVTHNQHEAMTLSDRIALMNQGRLVQCDAPNRLYQFPASEFVAAFIGNPDMNMFAAVVRLVEGDTVLEVQGNHLRVDQASAKKLKSWVNQRIRAGIRPQSLDHHLTKVGKRRTDTQVVMEVDLVEPLGHQNQVVGKLGEIPFVFLVDADIVLRPGEKLPVVVDGRKLHFFHPDTRENLFEPRERDSGAAYLAGGKV